MKTFKILFRKAIFEKNHFFVNCLRHIYLKTSLFLFFSFIATNAFSQVALITVDDYAKTGPLRKVRVNVVLNDILPSYEYTLQILSALDPITQGITELDGDYVIFTPGINCRGVTVPVEYKVNCAGQEETAMVYIEVTMYNTPLNVVPENLTCIVDMPANIPFGIKEKFRTAYSSGYFIDGLTSPMVADLNGDGKPEIIALGVTATSLGAGAALNGKYLNIYNGQTGDLLIRYDLVGGTGNFSMGAPYHRAPSLLAIADLDGDGTGEIVVAQTNGKIYALKPIYNGTAITGMTKMWDGHANGTVIDFRAPRTANFVYPQPYIIDLNGDGIPEVIVYNKVFNGQTGALLMSWQGAAPTIPVPSSITSTSGLTWVNSTTPTTQTNANNIKNVAMTGRRPGNGTYSDNDLNVMAVVDIDGDGLQEIITGNRIYKIQINSLSDHTLNTYTTIEGPVSVDLTENPNGTKTTHYLTDGLTRVADIDGDGNLDIIVTTFANNGNLDVKILVYVWDLQNPSQVKAANTYWSDGTHGNFSIPFIGDINGKDDGWDGTEYTKKLPEICIVSGAVYINRVTGNGGRTGIKFHPMTDEKIRQGTAGSSGTAAGWDNNQASNSNRRFNRGISNGGHIIGLTYDAQAADVEDRLKLSWGMEHTDSSDNTGITLFDFDNDGAKDLCYRDETDLRVISPKRGNNGIGSDYVTASEDVNTPGTSIMFRTACYSGTGFEYPTIADVNMDGSANIIVTQNANSRRNSAAAGFIRVFEYSGHKWSPCPPVWNQSLYNPLHINEDLTVPARPQSMLTTYTDGAGNTITPYNGVWIQQPIVKEGEDYSPVVRLPDALFSSMEVTVQTSTTTQVIISLYNNGTATVSASTPLSFYNGGTTGNPIAGSALLNTVELGIDLFPGEIVTQTHILSGNFNNCLIWARIMDNGTDFPAVGYDDCDLSNNAISGIDCPYLQVMTTVYPFNVICGVGGMVKLSVTAMDGSAFPFNYTPIFQWYKDYNPVPLATDSVYYATEAGVYSCRITDGICIKQTQSETITISQDCHRFTVNDEDYIFMMGKRYCDGVRDFKLEAFPKSTLVTVVWKINGTVLTDYTNLNIAYANGLTDGRYDVEMIANGESYSTHFYVGGIPVVWTPEANTTGTDTDKQDWNKPANWTPAVIPTNCHNVFIPGNSSHYPRPADSVYCNYIYFIQGAELARPDLLNYKRAYIQFNFDLKQYTQQTNPDKTQVLENFTTEERLNYSAAVSSIPLNRERWYMLSSPLRGVVTGDLGFGGFPLTFLMKFGPVDKDGVNYAVGKWTTPYTGMDVSLACTEGFAFYMYGYGMTGDNLGCEEWGYFGLLNEMTYLPAARTGDDYGLSVTNGVLELPFFEDMYMTGLNAHRTQSYDSSNRKSRFYSIDDGTSNTSDFNKFTGKYIDLTREENNGNYRFIPETFDGAKWVFPQTVYHSGSGLKDNDDFMVGNPFMSALDMVAFLDDNSATLQQNFKIWDGNSFISHFKVGNSIESPLGTAVSGHLAPLQAFFLTTLSTYAGAGNVAKFDVTSVSTTRPPTTSSNLRSGEITDNVLRIKAENRSAASYMLIGYKENATDGFRENEDVRKLFSPYGSVPEIYALAGEIPVDIRFINNKKEIIVPLGIRTTYTGEIKITVAGMDKYNKAARIELIDALENRTVDLTGMTDYTYVFNNTERGIQNGRFSLCFDNTITSLQEENGWSDLNIYGDSKGIYIVSSSSDPVQQVIVYDFQGKKVYESTSDANYHPLQQFLGHSPLIVKVITKNQVKTVKIDK